MNLRSVRKLFSRSPHTNRPMSVFSWNDHVDTDRIAAQMDSLVEHGAGGAVVSTGKGLPQDTYLHAKWLEALGVVSKLARKRRASIWLREDFSAGPTQSIVSEMLAERPELCQSRLVLSDYVVGDGDESRALTRDAVAAFVVTQDDGLHGIGEGNTRGRIHLVKDRIRVRAVEKDAGLDDYAGCRILAFEEKRSSGELNLFHAEGIEEFLSRTHAKIYSMAKRYFGNTLGLCMLSNVNLSTSAGELPWDSELPTLFRETRGYSILDRLPSLFFDTPGCEAVRYDYWTLVAEMFREGLAHPFANWCAERRIPCSGQFGASASLGKMTSLTGALMPLYESQDYPGVDVKSSDNYATRRNLGEYLRDIVAIKQAASVKRQLDKGGLVNVSSSEVEGCASPESVHLAGTFHLALGVNYLSHPGIQSSLRGDRKGAVGGQLGPPQPFWDQLGGLHDSLSRISWLLSQGSAVSEVLVLHPASSIQASYRHPRSLDEIEASDAVLSGQLEFQSIEKHFALLSNALLDAQIEFDYGDEELLARHGSVDRKDILVGSQRYRIIVLPPLLNIRSSTLSLLHDFATGGGIVLATGSVPRLVDGRPSREPEKFIEEYGERVTSGVDLFDYSAVVGRLTELDARSVRAMDAEGDDVSCLKVQRRIWENIELLYIANVSLKTFESTIELKSDIEGRIEEWDPATGSMNFLSECVPGQPVSASLTWSPGQSRIFVSIPGEDKNAESSWTYGAEVRRVSLNWYGVPSGPNTIPLLECRLVDDDGVGDWGSAEDMRGVIARRIEESGRPVPLRCQWRFYVSAERPVEEGCEVALELGQDSSAQLNGTELLVAGTDWTLDPAISCVPLPGLAPGENVLEVWRSYASAEDLQRPWVRGPFRVEEPATGESVICQDSELMSTGEWGAIGYPFFAGSVVYRTEVQGYDLHSDDRVVLEIPGLLGTAAVRINDKEVATILRQPRRCDITEHWKPGSLNIEIKVAGSVSNLLDALAVTEGGQNDATRGRYGLTTSPEIVIHTVEPVTVVSAADTETQVEADEG